MSETVQGWICWGVAGLLLLTVLTIITASIISWAT